MINNELNLTKNEDEAGNRLCGWMLNEVINDARGDLQTQLNTAPQYTFWLGRLLPQCDVLSENDNEVDQRLEPCAIGIRAQFSYDESIEVSCQIKAAIWQKDSSDTWYKQNFVIGPIVIGLDISKKEGIFGEESIKKYLNENVKSKIYAAYIEYKIIKITDELIECEFTLVNSGGTTRNNEKVDSRLYETELRIMASNFCSFQIESLPDSYSYERFVPAYGINCGILSEGNTLTTTDLIVTDKNRPDYWGANQEQPGLHFDTLSALPMAAEIGKAIVNIAKVWGSENWSKDILKSRSLNGGWSEEMLQQALDDSDKFRDEVKRLIKGVKLLESDHKLALSFAYMNEAMEIIGKKKGYDQWRAFQFAFLLANLPSIVEEEGEGDILDVVWFATGGGKTETYLGLLLTAIFYDRQIGKSTGISAWTRFPLRMLSLQQTQRFAEALAAAELVKQKHGIPGDQFSLGFFIGTSATPNKIPPSGKDGELHANNPKAFENFASILTGCPFCGDKNLTVKFDRLLYKTDLKCSNKECSFHNKKLPIHFVDHEIYRFLPTIIVGTLDKAAQISSTSGMTALVGAPWGICSESGHGFTYAPRSEFPNGCLVNGCSAKINPINMPATLFPPRYRLQDELHLLRDSLGAVDSHYESLYDDLSESAGSKRAKILASSATLKGFEKQARELYLRKARLFPAPEPEKGKGLWSKESEKLMRKYVAIAPRGLTLEWVTECIVTVIQRCVRSLMIDPKSICMNLKIDEALIPKLVDLYGTQLIYGNTLRDIEAVNRSGEIQQNIYDNPVNWESLTSKTDFDDVRRILDRLQAPEENYYDRIHAVTASSMISHGVDIDRFNTMVMMGLPLGTSDFIQATARVGRRYPALVFVVHKIARERDAQIFRLFKSYVDQSDRFVEPIPITRRSKRVLARTLPGIALSRITIVQEKIAGDSLQSRPRLKEWIDNSGLLSSAEASAVTAALGYTHESDYGLRSDIYKWYEDFWESLKESDEFFLGKTCPGGQKPMSSLRDVDAQVPVYMSRIK